MVLMKEAGEMGESKRPSTSVLVAGLVSPLRCPTQEMGDQLSPGRISLL